MDLSNSYRQPASNSAAALLVPAGWELMDMVELSEIMKTIAAPNFGAFVIQWAAFIRSKMLVNGPEPMSIFFFPMMRLTRNCHFGNALLVV